MRHANRPSSRAMLPRKHQNQANPFASAMAVGSERLPSEMNPVAATLRQMAAKTAETIIVARSESFMTVEQEDA